MISAKADYLYVVGDNVDAEHPLGDMDRLPSGFTGNVMPLRTGTVSGQVDKDGNAIQRQNILRGEDVCFLLEAVLERYVVSGESWNPMTFKKKLNIKLKRSTIYDLVVDFSSLGSLSNVVPIDSGLPASGAMPASYTSWDLTCIWTGLTVWPNGPIADAQWVAIPSVSSPCPLSKARLLAMFEDLKLLMAFHVTSEFSLTGLSNVNHIYYVPDDGQSRYETETDVLPRILETRSANDWPVDGWTVECTDVSPGASAINITIARGLTPGTVCVPIIKFKAYAYEKSYAYGSDQTNVITIVVDVTKYGYYVASGYTADSNGDVVMPASVLSDALDYGYSFLTAAGYSKTWALSRGGYYKTSSAYVTISRQLELMTKCGPHTKWW